MIMKIEQGETTEREPERVPAGDLLNHSHAVSFTLRELTVAKYVARKQGLSFSDAVRKTLFCAPKERASRIVKWERIIETDKKKGQSAWTHPARKQRRQRRQRS